MGAPLCACTMNISRAAHVPQSLSRSVWFQHEGAPSHYTNDVRQHLNVKFGQHWKGRGGPVHWPARSLDLSRLDFFYWGQMETLVYETPVDSEEDLVARISLDAREMQG
ncbi:hypothetical protein AVEN_110665-1 [Araneus ventricosus]|uniref:Tc1-like transposase DDE domain-containing protein n=1 Tax=Araneus ventricosus TaxID=182803 RepID=A0A4Y2ATJ6_ARAVE|nr:hypothetical protein AVEN_110665-1 [Araneus ventricosus]